MAVSGAGAHILVFPFPAPGHMLPLLDLTHHLASRRLSITILVTPKNLHLLTPLLSAHPTTVSTLLLPLPPHPSVPSGVENLKDLPPSAFKAMMVSLADLHNPIADWFHNHPSPPVAIVSDMFLGWTHRLAGELGIRRYTFSPSGAFAFSFIDSMWRFLPKRNDPENDNELMRFPNLPNSPVYPWWQLSPFYRSYVEGDPVSEFIKDGFNSNIASWGIVVNSFTELERVHIDHLKKEMGHHRVFPVGPLHPPGDKTAGRGGRSSDDVLSWLDTCQDRTVVYVCFGTLAVLTNGQMEAVAAGLEKSRVKFVWSVKDPTAGHVAESYGRVPDGFEDRVAGRGIVVRGWVPQVAVLSHDSVGVFLTHCGWNSVMEAVAAEVLMLTWPMTADQYFNATLLHELKVGVKVCEGLEIVPDSDELVRLFSESVGEGKRVERERVKAFAKAAKEAIGESGSSWKELDALVEDILHLNIIENQNK